MWLALRVACGVQIGNPRRFSRGGNSGVHRPRNREDVAGSQPAMNTVYPRTSSLATVSLIFGILAYIFLPGIGALVAVICGHSARAEIRRAPPGTIEGDGLALAGLILGWIQIVCGIIALGFLILLALGAIAFAGFR
jgi:hypothetical protein